MNDRFFATAGHPRRAPFRLPAFAGICLLTSAVTLLAGCASLVPPDSRLPQTPVPAAWSAQTPGGVPATSLAQWWQRFNDPQLTQLVTQALQANTSLRSAQAALQQARAQVDVQAAGLLPSVGASASAQRSRASNTTGNSFQAGFDASWEPDVFGRLRSGVNASEADAQAAEASLADVQVSLAAETAVNYIELRGLQQRLAIARSNLASQQETLQITQWRLQAGLTTSLVAEQALGAAEQTAAQIPALESSLAQSRHSLAVLTGQAPLALDAQWPTRLPCRNPRKNWHWPFLPKPCGSGPTCARPSSALPLRWPGCRRPMPRATPTSVSRAIWACAP
jgi:NodT family efflux transporter outer membrane factor (OMF) lipoprotein